MHCGASDWAKSTALLGLIGTDLREECEVTRCASCGEFYYMSDEQIEAAYNKLNGITKPQMRPVPEA